VLAEDARAFAVVDLEDSDDVLALPERDSDRAVDLSAHDGRGLADILARVGREDRGALLDDLAEHAARDRDRLGRATAAYPGPDRYVARRAPRSLVVLAERDRDVGRAADQSEDPLGHDVDELLELERPRDLLLRLVERVEHLGVGAEIGLDAADLCDALHRDDPRVVDVLLQVDLHADRPLRVAEEQDVLVTERDLTARALADVEHLAASDDAGAVRALKIADDVVVARQHDRRVLAGHVPLRECQVSALASPDAQHVCAALERAAPVLALDDLDSDHPERSRARSGRLKKRVSSTFVPGWPARGSRCAARWPGLAPAPVARRCA